MSADKVNKRVITLPTIKLNEVKKYNSSTSLLRSDLGPATCSAAVLRKCETPPQPLSPGDGDAGSPIGYTLKHVDELTLSADIERSVISESFTKANKEEDLEINAASIKLTSSLADELLDIRIFFPNSKAVQFSIQGGVLASAADLLDLMAKHLEIDIRIVADAFALWLISPLLEVQLKPHHIPFEVHQKWPVFLRRFAIADEEQIALDEPLLVIRRNFQLTIANERLYMEEYERLAEILYLDARDQYLAGRYLLNVEQAIELAGLQLAIDFEPFESVEQAVDLIEENIGQLVPAQHVSTIRAFRLFGLSLMECKHGMEHDVVNAFQRASNGYANNHTRRRAFLAALQETPFYGAAFFTGQKSGSVWSSLLNPLRHGLAALVGSNGPNSDNIVIVGINHEFITVVCPSRHELITCQRIANCHWRRAKDNSSGRKKTNEIPLFVLEYPDGSTLSSISHAHHKNFSARHYDLRKDSAKSDIEFDTKINSKIVSDSKNMARNQIANSVSVEFNTGENLTNDHLSIMAKEQGRNKVYNEVKGDKKSQHIVHRQIFSKQAVMMEALLNSICNELYDKFNLVK